MSNVNFSEAASDPQLVVDAWTVNVDAFKAISDEASNPEFKAAATSVYEDVTAVRDSISKIYVDQDMNAMEELTSATSAMQDSYTALITLCAG